MATIRKFEQIEESKLFKHLKSARTNNDKSCDQLAGNVREVIEQAKEITAQINRHMHQYTLHEGTHLWNVLSIMEALLPDKTIKKLTPLECALCIMAAFTHDSGMAWPDEKIQQYLETNDTRENREWLRHCDGYAEQLREIKRLKKIRDTDRTREAEANGRIKYLEGYLLAEFIRKEHAKIPIVRDWLTRMEKAANNQSLFYYGKFPFKEHLAKIGVSHNRNVDWLRGELGKYDEFCRPTDGGMANLAFPSLLVRLADIMDFDATRTPRILYTDFGIVDKLSREEWNKHMAISGWNLDEDKLLYAAESCEHPAYEKTIREFVKCIEHEIRQVDEELAYQRHLLKGEERYQIRLPRKVKPDIHAALDDDGKPIYIYHDLQFQLDKDAIQQLLMGESLYGDPSLCLRELIQNSLDALQLRDLRLRVLDDDPDAGVEKTDSLRRGEKLQVNIDWGRDADTGREFIRVRDNDCGMTRDTLEHFFAQLGKSYYRSPDYEREQQLFRQHGHVISPISQFGIGFLSCFMLADEISVKTRPGGADDNERRAHDVMISGPGNLFWFKQGTLKRQGTEITLFLKPRFRLAHDWERSLRWLRAHFGYAKQERETLQMEWQAVEQQGEIDPAWHVGRCAVWPMFPILLGPEGDSDPAIRLDGRFHEDVLAPIDREKLNLTASDCEIPVEALGQPRWECLDWEDSQGEDATGTRIRLVFPYHQPVSDTPLPLDPADTALLRAHELAALVETTLENDETRKRLAVRGMGVENLAVCDGMVPASAGVGTWLWVDLRGAVAPHLTADRKTALNRENREEWAADCRGVFGHWGGWLQTLLNEHSTALTPSLLSAFAMEKDLRPKAPATPTIHGWQLRATHYINYRPVEWLGVWLVSLLTQEITVSAAFPRNLNYKNLQNSGRSLDFIRDRSRYIKNLQVSQIDPVQACTLSLGLAFQTDLNIARNLCHEFTVDDRNAWRNDAICLIVRAFHPIFTVLAGAPPSPPSDSELRYRLIYKRVEAFSRMPNHAFWTAARSLYLLPEAFADDLSHSLPALGLTGLKGRAGDGWLKAPGWIEWEVDPITAEVSRDSPEKRWSKMLIEKGYDLVFPLTYIPLGRLRRDCPQWRSDHSLRAIGTLPFFMLGSEATIQQREALYDFFGVPRIHVLMPKQELWLKPFDKWTESDWNAGCLSALWDLESGCVYWAEGAPSADDMPKMGKPIDEFIGFKPGP